MTLTMRDSKQDVLNKTQC